MLTLLSSAALAALVSVGNADQSAYLTSSLPVQNLEFVETFDEKTGGIFTSGKWIKSSIAKYSKQPVMVKPAINAPRGFEKDKGLELAQEMKYYAVSSALKTPFDPKGKDIVIQYETKFDTFTCAGAYLKILRSTDDLDLTSIDNNTPFSIMFGPDRCGSNNKVHFILQHQNPISKVWEEKHFNNTPHVRSDKLTHLYTLHIRGDNSFEIFIDKESEATGNLLTHMIPPINPPVEIDDPTDIKPADWVNDPTMPDPSAVKPEDWDETLPAMIVDTSAVKPLGWREDLSPIIADPEAQKPEDWDDEEDGEWDAPQIKNPDCVAGCGPWSPPLVKNPDYKGKWHRPLITNPDYIGEWKPRQIPNPDYYFDATPSHVAPMAAVAFEIWTTNAGIHFDNIVIAHSIDDAWAFADASFLKKREAEFKLLEEQTIKEKQDWQEDHISKNGIRGYIDVYMSRLIEFIELNPILKGGLIRASTAVSGLLGATGLKFVEENATSIIIGFSLLFFTTFIFVFCSYVVPRSSHEADIVGAEEETVATENEKVEDIKGPTEVSQTEKDEASKDGLQQRKKKTPKEN